MKEFHQCTLNQKFILVSFKGSFTLSHGNGNGKFFFPSVMFTLRGLQRQRQQQHPNTFLCRSKFAFAVAIAKWVYNPFHDDTFAIGNEP